MGEKLFVENLIFYVAEIPIFIFPFSLYLPLEKGRRSGLIVPSFYFSNSRGVVFQNFGYYWAASDY
jgi:lipopolysaccharide assembly outer membrane protein LptD (OstA)